ncbi:unnamed protein product [Rotaria magnacalcarata]|uniref:Uncharacterized protein n=1 Tax=Rotaria magnacalcarata TaxID=392030 RepID=A0A819TGK5_9BILA|nr:unnamed protein product [Rotaria magnacalcarata]CAF3938759.1 unnamed protein product [Rotaria magnacalcarata]CAF4077560.1 unnamed protein product [Rotaria magnacalcarata]CAF4821727.1 unnamed protein product [Rotaria magnacalcarata]CAF5185880.1 unnamed protein product [Rotaria magnacalcarata]
MAVNDTNYTMNFSSQKCMCKNSNLSSFQMKFYLAGSLTGVFPQNSISLSSPNSPSNSGNLNSSLSHGRQLWSMAVENIHEREKTPPTSSSSVVNDSIRWCNLTKR